MDKRLYLDVNRLATQSAWAHGVGAFLARPWALAILVALLVVAVVRARVGGLGGSDLDQLAVLVWTVIATGLAFALSLLVVHLVARARPFVAMPQAVVLISKPTGFGFPDEHAVIAGAVAAGLWLCRARLIAALATLFALLIAFAAVYAGTAYPSDALAGLLLGALVSLVLYPIAIVVLRDVLHAVAQSPLKPLVGGGHHRRTVGFGPAAHPEPVGESGAVRILSPDEVGTVRILARDDGGGGAEEAPPAHESGAGTAG